MHWATITGDAVAILAFLVAAVAWWTSWRTGQRSVTATEALAAIEAGRRHAERVPRLSARVECWGAGTERDFTIAVWLESAEALARLRVLLMEARNNDGPLGFRKGQAGVPDGLPWAPELDELNGVLPAWRGDSLMPVADWPGERLAPGAAALWGLQLRRNAEMGGGSAAVRVKALCTAGDGEQWEVTVPVTFSDRARELTDDACRKSGK